ncbi:MAG: GGDEF domain-containing protein [Bdellovibrionales bacterium]|nr:GGDEF domain-containing protein [Massilia sp.]
MNPSCNGCPACEPLRAQLAAKECEIAELRALARHDQLTGVLNRRSIAELVGEELQRSSRTGQPFCFAIIGVDHLTELNTQFGNDTGDLVLKTIARESCLLLRTLDRFGRLDQDLFGIILPATWLHQGVMAMNRLNAFVANFDWNTVTTGRTVTFSTGLTTNAPAENAEKMIARALKAMRQAKAEGRNRLVTLEEELDPSLFAAMDD